jgi:hypothetical protein
MACTSLILTALTPADFKARFIRGFNYLPGWDNALTYKIGSIVYIVSNDTFYKAIVDQITSDPLVTPAEWEVYPGEVLNYVSDADITVAYSSACANFNDALINDDTVKKESYLLLTAHRLVVALREAGVDSVAEFPSQSHSAGSVSSSELIPAWLNNSISLISYASTNYGIEYISMIKPYAGGAWQIGGGSNA